MNITAAVLGAMGTESPYAESKPLVIEKLQLDAPGPGEVLVRIKAAGLCHSDLSVINGNRPRPTPMALGHEAAGIVEEVGPVEGEADGSDLRPGDHVVFVFVPSCGHCEPCTEGRPALCEPGAAANTAGTLLSGAHRLHRSDGTPVHHHLGVSAFADYAMVSRRSLVKIDRRVAVRRGRPLRVRGADRRGRGRQYRSGTGGLPPWRWSASAAWGCPRCSAPWPPERVRWWPSTCPTRSSTSPASSARP